MNWAGLCETVLGAKEHRGEKSLKPARHFQAGKYNAFSLVHRFIYTKWYITSLLKVASLP